MGKKNILVNKEDHEDKKYGKPVRDKVLLKFQEELFRMNTFTKLETLQKITKKQKVDLSLNNLANKNVQHLKKGQLRPLESLK